MRIPAYPTRVGVFDYLRPDGTVQREYRPPEEVQAQDSLDSLKHAPVTDLHPEREGVRIPVTPENYKDLAVGHVAENVRPDGDMIATDLLIQDQNMILKVESGDRRELSCGYDCVLDMSPGVSPKGEVYDVIQRQIRYNHVGLGPPGWGRQGPSVALRLDSGDGIQIGKDHQVMKETIDGKEYTIGTPEWAAAIKARADRQVKEAQARADGLAKELDTAKKEPDPKVLDAIVQRRVRLITDCKLIASRAGMTFDEAAVSTMSEGDVMKQAILQMDPQADLEGLDPAGIVGYFKAMVRGMAASAGTAEEATDGDPMKDEQPAPAPGQPVPDPTKKTDAKTPASIFTARAGTQRQDSGTDQGQRQSNQRQDQKGPDADKARQDMLEKQRNAWKNPLASSKK